MMHRFFYGLSLSAMLLFGCSLSPNNQRTALIYGVSAYLAKSLNESPNLNLPRFDAQKVASTLESKGWVAKARIASTVDPASMNSNNVASKDGIRADIQALKGSKGLVLFYFSGHGMLLSNGTTYICPYGSVDAGGFVPAKGISVTELHSMFAEAGLQHVVIILDTCHSGGFVSPGATVDSIPPSYGKSNPNGGSKYDSIFTALPNSIKAYTQYSSSGSYVTIAAAGIYESSWESSRYNHGIFTYAFLKAASDASKADIDQDSVITTSEIYMYCSQFIMKYWNNGKQTDYHPHLSGNPIEYALWKR